VEAEGDVLLDAAGDGAGALELSEGALVLEALIELHGGTEVALEVVGGGERGTQRTAHEEQAEDEPEGGSTRRGGHGEGY
jgi:hypothetical protein